MENQNSPKKWTKLDRTNLRKAITTAPSELEGIKQYAAATGRTEISVKNVWTRIQNKKRSYTPRITTNTPGLMAETVSGASIIEYLRAKISDESEITFKGSGKQVVITF